MFTSNSNASDIQEMKRNSFFPQILMYTYTIILFCVQSQLDIFIRILGKKSNPFHLLNINAFELDANVANFLCITGKLDCQNNTVTDCT